MPHHHSSKAVPGSYSSTVRPLECYLVAMSFQFPKTLSKEEINLLPLYELNTEVILVETEAGARRAAEELAVEPVLGFDTETRPSFTKGERYEVSLLQLASEKRVFLFRLNMIKLPAEVAELLSNPNILKPGVAVHDDIKALQRLRPFGPAGFVELNNEAKKLGVINPGLRLLAAIFLGVKLSKAAKVTNWDRRELTPAQISYAACDAVAGLLIHHKIREITEASGGDVLYRDQEFIEALLNLYEKHRQEDPAHAAKQVAVLVEAHLRNLEDGGPRINRGTLRKSFQTNVVK
jgi:ribonuclease D